ncbi:MAG: peptide-methionine (S)-S-oxide reductase MsrA [Verrucomicrobiota bacterium]
MKKAIYYGIISSILVIFGWQFISAEIKNQSATEPMSEQPDEVKVPEDAGYATFGGGCFWCVEEVFHQVPGVLSAVSGYMGGSASDAHYKAVSSGRTQHAEVVQLRYDPGVVSYPELLDHFFDSHDPTTLNRQGADRGPQYRSVIFYHDDLQKEAAEAKIVELTEVEKFRNDIVTEVSEASEFHVAESYHQDFARKNPGHGYLRGVLYPKLRKLGLKIPAAEE